MSNFITPNTLLISVPVVNSGGNTLNAYIFPTQQDLVNRKIIGIESYCIQDMDFDPKNPGSTPLSLLAFKNCFLTLYTSAVKNPNMADKNQEPGLFYDKIPLFRMRALGNSFANSVRSASYANDVFRIRPTVLAFNKCKIEFPNTIAIGTAPMSAVFMFHYLDEGDNGEAYNVHQSHR